MKISFGDYIKSVDASVLVAEAIFCVLGSKYPLKTIYNLAETTSGGTPLRTNQDYFNGTIPWLKSGELNDGYIYTAEETITDAGVKNSSAKIFPSDTLLLAMYGATVGRTGITKIEAATNQAICAIFPKEIIRRDFLYWFFRQHRYTFIQQSKGGAQPNISQTVINQTKVPLPELELQDKLVSILDQIQAKKVLDLTLIPDEFKEKVKIAFHCKSIVSSIEDEILLQIKKLKRLRQQIQQDAIQGKLVPQNPDDEPAGKLLERIKAEKELLVKQKKIKKEKPLPPIKPEEIPFEIPKNWVWCKLGDMACNIEYGTSEKADLNLGDVPILRMNNILNGKLDFTMLKYVSASITDLPKLFLRNGDLLFNRTNSWELVGKSAVFHGKDDLMTFASYLIRVQFNETIAVDFINYYINSLQCRITQVEPEIIQQNGQANFNGTKLKNIICPLPPLSEQHRIVQKIDQLMKYCDELAATIQQNQNYTKELLQVALKEALNPAFSER